MGVRVQSPTDVWLIDPVTASSLSLDPTLIQSIIQLLHRDMSFLNPKSTILLVCDLQLRFRQILVSPRF